MKPHEIIAYQGESFTIEWYIDERGNSQAFEYFAAISEDRQDAALALFKRMGDSGKIFDLTKFRNEGNKIFAFKPQPDRYLCFFFTGKKIIVTNAFEKKSQKLPIAEQEKAIRAKVNYQERVRLGVYYV